MSLQTLQLFFYFTLLIILLQNILLLLSNVKIFAILRFLALFSSFISIAGIYIYSGHLPVSGSFDKYQNIVFFILLIDSIDSFFSKKKLIKNTSIWYVLLCLQLLVFLDELKPSEHYLIYDKPMITLFFQLRMLSVSMFAYALSCYLNYLFSRKNKSYVSEHLNNGRNFTLLGSAMFMGGEMFGSYWALQGWGDTWRWSKGFFLATAMFLLAMVTAHLPAKYTSNRKQYVYFSIIPLILILLLYIF